MTATAYRPITGEEIALAARRIFHHTGARDYDFAPAAMLGDGDRVKLRARHACDRRMVIEVCELSTLTAGDGGEVIARRLFNFAAIGCVCLVRVIDDGRDPGDEDDAPQARSGRKLTPAARARLDAIVDSYRAKGQP